MKKIIALLFLGMSAVVWAAQEYHDLGTIASGTVASTGVLTSTIIDARGASQVGIQASWTTGGTGVFAIKGSTDYVSNGASAHWTTLTPTLTAPANSASSAAADFVTAMPYIEVVYTSSSGSLVMAVSGFTKSYNQQ